MKRLTLPVLIMLLLCAFPVSAHSADWPTASQAQKIDALVAQVMKEARIPGIAVGIVEGDKAVYLKGYGAADSAGRPVTPQTPFIIGSVSKSFTAMAVMQQVEAGKIDLDAPVQTYLPWFQVADEAVSAKITVRHLLNHTSGLTRSDADFIGDFDDRVTAEQIVRQMAKIKVTWAPGEQYDYCNLNYITAALIVQTVSGIPFDQYISQRIFAPLKMTHSFTNEPAAIADGMATGHLYFSNLFPVPYQALYSRGRLGEGFIISSAEDMTHYLLAMMHEGAYGGTAALPSAAVKAVTTPAVPEGRYPGANSYGMGWSIGRRGSDLIWLHGGATSTFRAEMAILPNSFRGVIVLANAKLDTTEGVNRLANALVQILRDQEPNLATAAPASSAYALLALFCGALLIALADLLWLPRWRRQVRARGITRWDWLRTAFSLALALGFLVGLPMSLGANLLFAMRVDPYDGAVICAVGALALAAFGYRLAVIWRSKKEVPSHHAQAS